MPDKPLFIPLQRQYFERFKNGLKKSELRLYGARWNERVCSVGRPVTLSLGYGKQQRLSGVITGFEKQDYRELGDVQKSSIVSLYGVPSQPIAIIHIKLNQ